jgi:hypothetical protein
MHADVRVGAGLLARTRAASASMPITTRAAACRARTVVRPGILSASAASAIGKSSTDREQVSVTTTPAVSSLITPERNSSNTFGSRLRPRASPSWVPAAVGPMLRAIPTSPITDNPGSP